MDRATSFSYIQTILLALVLVILCLGNTDLSLSNTLNNKIQILETKDREQQVRIEVLEQQVLSMVQKLNIISTLTSCREQKHPGQNEPKLYSTTTSRVAFHARQIKDSVMYPNLNDVIKFENVTLNEGNGYHSRQGLFVTPKAGIYLFTVTLVGETESGYNMWASVRKNGAMLARIDCIAGLDESKKSFDQSSVTIVTDMNVSDELWTDIYSPGNVSIGGNGFSTFSGVLLEQL